MDAGKDRQNPEWWERPFRYVADKCPHLVGRNDRRWTADLEWIIKQGNLIKIIEGKYER